MVFPVIIQNEKNDCGPAALMMIFKYYDIACSWNDIYEGCRYLGNAITLYDLGKFAQKKGMMTLAVRCSIEDLKEKVPLPVIAFLKKGHFIVIYRITKNYVWTADPYSGRVRYLYDDFAKRWFLENSMTGVVLALEKQEQKNNE